MAYIHRRDGTVEEMPGLEYHHIVGLYNQAMSGDLNAVKTWADFADVSPGLARLGPHIDKAYAVLAPDHLTAAGRTAKTLMRKKNRRASRKDVRKAAYGLASEAFRAGQLAASAPPAPAPAVKTQEPDILKRAGHPIPPYLFERTLGEYSPSIYSADPAEREKAWKVRVIA